MFALPRSSWQDYDKGLISKGGGVYPRASKEIRLSAEARKLFGVAEAVTPQELMKAILKAKVDLLFFGGIGTYIRASSEGDEAAGDRANDAIRITGADLNCKVIGEGANLGMTQRGRIEAAQHGIRLNTDAIDNSAGVNTSDVEVNIKIALSGPVRSGALTIDARNAFLAEMTDEVARLVLRNNYQQTLALSMAQRRGLEDLGFQQRLMQTLEVRGELDRGVEFLPDEMAIAERRKRNAGLTRPELAVLLAYAKLSLYSELLDSKMPDDPYLGRELGRYFPKEMSERYADALHAHRLRREIIATQLTNSMINRGGATLIVRIADQTGAAPPAIAAAFAAVRNSYDLIAPQRRDRRARQQDRRQDAARSLHRGAGLVARPAGLVPAQCRSDPGSGENHRALSRGNHAGHGSARWRAVEVRRCCPRNAGRRARQGGRSRSARASHRQPAGVQGRA